MEFFEEEALNSAPVKPVWKRYVDGIVKKGSEKQFLLDHLNSVRLPIKFTMESEEDIIASYLFGLLI